MGITSRPNPRPNHTPAHKPPKRATTRRLQALSTESPTSRFLYLILRQCDQRSVNWQEIANDTGVTKGHTARMRYTRFKNQMEVLLRTQEQEHHEESDAKESKKGEEKKTAYRQQSLGMPLDLEEDVEYVKDEVTDEPGKPQRNLKQEPTDMSNDWIKPEPDIVSWSQPALSPHVKLERLESDHVFQPSFMSKDLLTTRSGISKVNSLEASCRSTFPSILPQMQHPYHSYWSQTPSCYMPRPTYQPLETASTAIRPPQNHAYGWHPYSRT